MSEEKAETKVKSDCDESPEKSCDIDIIKFVSLAINKIKDSKQNCNVSQIFKCLKEQNPNDEKIIHLTEACLTQQIELAIRDGILSRKYNCSLIGSSDSMSIITKKNLPAGTSRQIIKLPTENELAFKSESQVIFYD